MITKSQSVLTHELNENSVHLKTSISPISHQYFHCFLFSCVSAPVSGGPGGAEAGTLTVMMGGNPVTVGRVKPLLENFSTNIVHFGDIGEQHYPELNYVLRHFMFVVFLCISSFIISLNLLFICVSFLFISSFSFPPYILLLLLQ